MGTGSFGDGTHRTITYAYDDDGNRGSVTYPGLAAFGYDYTARNQLKDMTFGGANVVGYTYDPNGNPLSRAPGANPTASSFAFDARNRVTDITHNFDVGAKTYHYTYDEVGNRSTTRRDGGVIDTLGYDNNSQMTRFSLGGVATNLTYDASGNRSNVGTTGYSVNGLNQYTAVGPGSSLLYSTNGNLNSYNNGSITWSYSFDAENHLTSAAQGSTSAIFSYDGLGRQIARTINGVTSYSLWDGANRVAEYGTGGSVLNRWIYAGGDLVRSGTAALRYYYADGLGSTSHLADASGNLLERYTYDLAGTPSIYAPGSVVPLSGSAYGVDMLFTGQKWYPALGLYDLRARAYLPSLGRFLQPDPIGFAGDASNIYRYCGNNPANWSDPSGLGFWSWIKHFFTEDKDSGNPGNSPAAPEYGNATGNTGGQGISTRGQWTNSSGLPLGAGGSGVDATGQGGGGSGGYYSYNQGSTIVEVGYNSPESYPGGDLGFRPGEISTPAAATQITLAFGPVVGGYVSVTRDKYGHFYVSGGGQVGKSWPVSVSVSTVDLFGNSQPSAAEIANALRGLGYNGSAGFDVGGQVGGSADSSIFNPFSMNGAGPPTTYGFGYFSPQAGVSLGYTFEIPSGH